MTIGIIGALLLGIGMCFTMVWTKFFALGIIVGIVGIAILVFAYPIYKKTVQKNRAKIAHKILELSSKL
jgi:uncharacterized membrane protein YeaQ/YmgE (transglycosylase-associated protein family)